MKLDEMALDIGPGRASSEAQTAQKRGLDGWFVSETSSDPFVLAALGGQATRDIEIGTGVAVAFARNPMTLAYSANDLQLLTGGRLVLGIGSQVRAHIERRYSMPWSKPASRMREFVEALRAIWAAWLDDEPLDFQGQFYEHRLMTPHFSGVRHGFGPPVVGVAAVGPGMTRVAGEVADLVLCNPFTTRKYVDEVTVPAIAEGSSTAGRPADSCGLSIGVFVVTGRTDEERVAVDRTVRERLAFYASTPAYRCVLACHGLEGLHDELKGLARRQEWTSMGDLVGDEMLDRFALVVDDPDDVGAALRSRWGGVADRVWLYPTWVPDDRARDALRDEIRGGT